MNLKKIFSWILYSFLFLLPWQTRWIYDPVYLNGGFFEYGSGSLYGTEILLWIILIIFFIDWFRKKEILREFLPRNIFKMQLALWCGGVAQGILAIWQFFSQHIGANKWLGLAEHGAGDLGAFVIEVGDERWLRAYGSFGSPNALGIYLAVILIIGLFLVIPAKAGICRREVADSRFRGNDKVKKYLFTIGQLFILSGLILSFSRGAWVAAVAGVVALLFVIARERSDRSNPPDFKGSPRSFQSLAMTVKQILFYFIIIIFFFIALRPLFITRVDAIGRLETKSIAERVSQFTEWKIIFFAHPLLGVGLNKYTQYLHDIHPNLPVWQYQPIHNIYLLELAELGIVGMIFLLVIWFFFFKFVWQKNRVYLPVLITLLVVGLFDHWLWSMFTGVVFWCVVLVLCVLILPKYSEK